MIAVMRDELYVAPTAVFVDITQAFFFESNHMSDPVAATPGTNGVSGSRKAFSICILLATLIVLGIELRAGLGQSRSAKQWASISTDGTFNNVLLADAHQMLSLNPRATVIRENKIEKVVHSLPAQNRNCGNHVARCQRSVSLQFNAANHPSPKQNITQRRQLRLLRHRQFQQSQAVYVRAGALCSSANLPGGKGQTSLGIVSS